jgi:hypothetical protein
MADGSWRETRRLLPKIGASIKRGKTPLIVSGGDKVCPPMFIV